MIHKLKIQFWQNGTLVTRTHEFPEFDSALNFASKIKKQSLIRIYNEYNELREISYYVNGKENGLRKIYA